MEKRLVDLEERYTHLERQLEELNDVVFEQDRRIGALEKQLFELRARFADTGDNKDRADEKPPHY